MTENRKRIAHLILSGGCIADIQKEFCYFPKKPTSDFFEMLGYAKSTSQKYLSILRGNELAEQEMLIRSGFTLSENADINNLLVDTSAIGHSECIDLIKRSAHVTILTPTLKEMDEVHRKKFHESISKSIASFSDIVLNSEKDNKFEISRYEISGEEYVDEVLIKYINILPPSIRPTLLTADINLCLKAKRDNLEYIYYSKNQEPKTSDGKDKTPGKSETALIPLGFGLYFKRSKKKFWLDSDGSFSFTIINGKKSKKEFHAGKKYSEISLSVDDKIKVIADKEYVFQVKHILKKIE